LLPAACCLLPAACCQPAQAVWLEANQRAASVASGQPAGNSQPPSSQPC
jgi:hypothetical protein